MLFINLRSGITSPCPTLSRTIAYESVKGLLRRALYTVGFSSFPSQNVHVHLVSECLKQLRVRDLYSLLLPLESAISSCLNPAPDCGDVSNGFFRELLSFVSSSLRRDEPTELDKLRLAALLHLVASKCSDQHRQHRRKEAVRVTGEAGSVTHKAVFAMSKHVHLQIQRVDSRVKVSDIFDAKTEMTFLSRWAIQMSTMSGPEQGLLGLLNKLRQFCPQLAAGDCCLEPSAGLFQSFTEVTLARWQAGFLMT